MSRCLFVYGTKGGVGKSTVAVNLAYALHARGRRVGLLDLDLTGPSVQHLVGALAGTPPTMRGFRIQPGCFAGVAVSGLGFFTPAAEAPFLPGRYLDGALEQLAFHDGWDEVDVMVVDLPPGFSELHRKVLTRLAGRVVLVTTPHLLSTEDLARGVRLLERLGATAEGVVENMSYFTCPNCASESSLFEVAAGDGVRHLPVLGRIPFEPGAGRAAGVPAVVDPQTRSSRFAETLHAVAEKMDEVRVGG